MKHIIYKYDDDRSDEMDFDAHGSLTFTEGDLISRQNTSWKIEAVKKEASMGVLSRIPTYWVYLTRVFGN